jgi:DNA adenine methylase
MPAKPFIKWAGGKTQLLPQFQSHYPAELKNGDIHRFVEPFLGSGAVFFDIAQNFPAVREFFLGDINAELIIPYQVVKQHPDILITHLQKLKQDFLKKNDTRRAEMFYQLRSDYNQARLSFNYRKYTKKHWIPRAAQMIFLNKTCYNGLFRLNRSGGFNVPFGRYKKPAIFAAENLLAASKLLQNVELRIGHFDCFTPLIDEQTFVYFDPPYRPLSETASFTAYSQYPFDDAEQIALARYFATLDRDTGAKLMLSNSAPTDGFFAHLYQGFQIHEVSARRAVNSKASKRGAIAELLICNY